MPLQSIELFAGAGGLALGFSQHGVVHRAVVEWNSHACQTIRNNKRHGVAPVAHWPDVTEGDVRDFQYFPYQGIDLITGGPPCQPFSMGGKHGGFLDARDMFPQAIRAVRETRPRAFVFENVKGLKREAFSDYLDYIVLQLEYPSLLSREDETWPSHLARLRRERTARTPVEYRVEYQLVNAADYGVPQKRMRLFIVGFHADIDAQFLFPQQTHSQEALLFSQWGSGEYWDQHRVARANRPERPAGIERRLQCMLDLEPATVLLPWRTVRDAIHDLPDPEPRPSAEPVQAHKFQPGARSYPGHTGSPLDEPAKALKAGAHGVPGGENMLRRPDGSVRYFTVRESARIQTFPDEFILKGSWGEVMRQLGNAVPVQLASAVAGSVCGFLHRAEDVQLQLAVA
jgi:DNA (cytosine-5)-methyltransferase 1